MRTPGQGEELMAGMTREGFAGDARLRCHAWARTRSHASWKAYDGDERRAAHLALYRSGDFEKLEPYAGRLAALGVPALLIWGADDPMAPVKSGRVLRDELPGLTARRFWRTKGTSSSMTRRR